jgi:cytochrome c biogenesis protein CcmG, thiol:disulfide interchange protein DsbE
MPFKINPIRSTSFLPATQIYLFFFLFFSLFLMGESYKQAKPWMGIAIENKPNGVGVLGSIPGTPAERAGFLKGDLIKKIDSTQITDSTQLIDLIQSKGVGNQVLVELERNSKNIQISLQLEARPDELELLRKKLSNTKVPPFQLDQILTKGIYSNQDIASKVTVIEFWATWCPACVGSHPRLSKFAKDNPEIRVLAVSDEKRNEIEPYITKINPNFIPLRDSTKEFSKHFGVSAIPMILVIDKTGTVQHITLGGGSNLEDALKLALELKN